MRFTADSDQITSSAQTAMGTVQRLESEVSTLMGQLNALEGSWNGPAAAAFQSALGNWRATSQTVQESLQALSSSLSNAGAHYGEVESGITSMFAGR